MSPHLAPMPYYPVYHPDSLAEGFESPLSVQAPFLGPVVPARPHLHVSTDYGSACQADGEYLVRDFFTPSPSSSSPSDRTPPSASYAETASTSLRSPSSAISPVRRDSRRRGSVPSSSDEGLVVRGSIAHPYARLYSKKHGAGKRRKMWNHALEKMLFTPQEISTMGAPHRRTIYTASLEAHVDRLHEQLLSLDSRLYPVSTEELEHYRGLNSKTAKSMVSGLHHDAVEIKLKIRELERANRDLEEKLNGSSLGFKSCL
ncbi:hypothetical protein C8Q77DRAFT_84804 [Trametes polyzona]|nr:hypothetical protein C8Q77DRAFT_84804 [Trametes polyzona]